MRHETPESDHPPSGSLAHGSESSPHSDDKDYGSKGYAGTSAKTDDVAGGKLQVAKLYTYTPCPGSLQGGGGGGSSSTGGSSTGGVETTSGAQAFAFSIVGFCMLVANMAALV